MGLAAERGGNFFPLYGKRRAALVVQNIYSFQTSYHKGLIVPAHPIGGGHRWRYAQRAFVTCVLGMVFVDQQRTVIQFPARLSNAIFNKGGKSLPRRAARLKIPAQAFGDKEYFSGASGSKICDKEHAPAPLCCSEILGVVHAPCEINASASYHTGIGPPSRIRHWNFGRCERLQGFPDGWTEYGADGRPISDANRYQMLGNSVAIPCVAYIMQGIVGAMETR